LKYRFSKIIWLISAFVLIGCTNLNRSCSSNWKITGFYTPDSNQFESIFNQSLKIHRHKKLRFNKEFINAVRTEGWGKTRFGWYLGYYGNMWHRNEAPLNSIGRPLTIGSAAVDSQVIQKGKRIQIPFVQRYINVSNFIADDVGSAVKNNHIDIYTGEGHEAKLLTYKITGYQNVCVL
jgi:3D (Asp-Asp-Asp) domain-containing protein